MRNKRSPSPKCPTIGSGSNGKSTFLRVLLRLLGEFGCQAPPDLLLAKRGDVHPTEQASLFGRRLAVCTEVGQGRAVAEATVKQLTGGDMIAARRMREDFWEFAPTHKLWIAANHKPFVRGTDHAIWRRMNLIPFNVQFDDGRKDPALLDKLTRELPGILRWGLEGCREWQRDGLRPPESVQNATNEYRAEMDVVGRFLNECVEEHRGAQTKAADLYCAYRQWCDRAGEHPEKERTFGTALRERGFTKEKRGVIFYRDIRLGERAG